MLSSLLRAGPAAFVLSAALAAPAAAQCLDTLSAPRDRLVAVSVGGRALFAGGGDGSPASSVVDLFDAASGSWSSAALSEPRVRIAATTHGSRAYFGGGGRESSAFGQMVGSAAVDVYDATTGSWSSLTLSRGRWGLAAAAVGNEVLFAGGSRTNGPPFPPSDTVDVWDVAASSWSLATLSEPRTLLAATTVGDVALFAGGYCLGGASCVGASFDLPGFSPVVDLYDASSGQWSTATLSEPRSSLAATSVGSVALFAGGWSPSGPSATVDLWDASTGQWRTASLSQPRAELVACTVGTYALFAGGEDSQGPSAVVDVWDSATDTWYATTLSTPRAAAAAAVLGGEVLLGGGTDAAGTLASVERLLGGLAASYADGASGCPCGNAGAAGTGCASSTGAGATLALACPLGAPVAASFIAQGLVPLQAAILFAGPSASAPAAFGDGLLAVASPRRLGTRTADAAGRATWPQSLAGSSAPGGPWTGGPFRYAQAWYRDPASPCGTGFNATNALRALLWN